MSTKSASKKSKNNKLNFLLIASFCLIIIVIGVSAQNDAITPSNLDDILSEVTPLIPELTEGGSSPSSSTSGRGFLNRITSLIKSFVPERLARYVKTVDENYNVKEKVEAFKTFVLNYHKNYNVTEIPRRLQLFVGHLRDIEESVRNFAAGKSTYQMGLNKFADMDEDELKVLTSLKVPEEMANNQMVDRNNTRVVKVENMFSLFGQIFSQEPFSKQYLEAPTAMPYSSSYGSSDARVPRSKDWRRSGCLSEVQDQNDCGACYAFATLGVVEAMMCLKKRRQETLSVQELVDCSTRYGNLGCNGGWPTRVLRYLNDKGKISREACYPYNSIRMRQGYCKTTQTSQRLGCTVPASVDGTSSKLRYAEVKGENQMIKQLADNGPLVGLIQSNRGFLYYKRGVFTDSSCSRRDSDVNHGIVLAGYGEENGHKYWLIKNSWGESWGEEGYGKVRRGTNECSIESLAWSVLNE